VKNIPAFPTNNWQKTVPMSSGYSEGMTLRDYFAAKAMQGLLASEVNAPLKTFATKAYEMADAMMEARNAAQ
jgi:hypothetical protein